MQCALSPTLATAGGTVSHWKLRKAMEAGEKDTEDIYSLVVQQNIEGDKKIEYNMARINKIANQRNRHFGSAPGGQSVVGLCPSSRVWCRPMLARSWLPSPRTSFRMLQ